MPNPFSLQTQNQTAILPYNMGRNFGLSNPVPPNPPPQRPSFTNSLQQGVGQNPAGNIPPQGGKTGTPTNQPPTGQQNIPTASPLSSTPSLPPFTANTPSGGYYNPQTQQFTRAGTVDPTYTKPAYPTQATSVINPPGTPPTGGSPVGAAGQTGTIPVPAIGTPTGTPQGQIGGGQIGSFFNQMQSLPIEQQRLLGLAPTPAQQYAFQSAQESLPRLLELQNAMRQAGIPSEQQVRINQSIAETQKALLGLYPQRYAQMHDVTSMSQSQLEQQVAKEREPITESLANLVLSKSILGEEQQRNVQIAQANYEAQQGVFQMQQTLAQLFPQPKLPEGVQSEFFKAGLGLNLPPEFQMYNRALQSGQIPAGTSYPDFKLSMEPKRESHFETIGNRKVQITTDQFGNTIDRKDIGAAPTNAFNFFQNNPEQASGLTNAVQSGLLNPSDVNSRNMGFMSALYNANPNFNQVQAKAAATFFDSTGTQDKLSWINTTEKDMATLESLSAKVDRTASPLINSALLRGESKIAGNANATAFIQASNRVAASLSRVLGDSGGSDFRTKLANGVLDPSFSPQTLQTVLNTEHTLINNLKGSIYQQGGQNQGNNQEKNSNDPLGIR